MDEMMNDYEDYDEVDDDDDADDRVHLAVPNVKYPGLEVPLIGTDGNAYALIAKVKRAIQRHVGGTEGRRAADEFASEAMNSSSYNELLSFIMSTVEVTEA
jgi:hypothetical protein